MCLEQYQYWLSKERPASGLQRSLHPSHTPIFTIADELGNIYLSFFFGYVKGNLLFCVLLISFSLKPSVMIKWGVLFSIHFDMIIIFFLFFFLISEFAKYSIFQASKNTLKKPFDLYNGQLLIICAKKKIYCWN